MLKYTSLPGTTAVPLTDKDLEGFGAEFTYTVCKDEQTIYNDLDKRLMDLEISLEAEPEELRLITEKTAELVLLVEEKEMIQLRIGWLNSLYTADKEIGQVRSKQQAEGLLKSIRPVQSSPMKKQLAKQLEELINSFSKETQSPENNSFESELAEVAIENGNPIFINLGAKGRKFVVSEVVKQYGNKAVPAHVEKEAAELELHIQGMTSVREPKQLITDLDALPLADFSDLAPHRKLEVAEKLIEQRSWTGLVSLNLSIKHLLSDKSAGGHAEEIADTTIATDIGDAATTLNISDSTNGFVIKEK